MNYLKKELYNLVKTDSFIFEFIKNHALDGLWYWDLEKPKNKWSSDKFWKALGYNPKTMPHKASASENIINRDDFALISGNLKKHLNNPSIPYVQTIRYTHKNRRTVWIKCKGIAIKNTEGNTTRMLGSYQNITKLKENEIFLKRCNQEANIGFWHLDLSNETVFWSDVTKKIHGVPINYIPNLESGITFFKEGYSRERITELMFKAMNHEQGFNEELQITTLKGETKWVKAIGIPEKNGENICRVYGTLQDINSLKNYRLKLEESEQAFRGNFENAAIGMALLSRKGQWLRVNKTLCDIVGYTPEELSQLTFLDISHKEDLDLDLVLLKEITDGKRDHYQMDKRYLHKQGHIKYIHLSVSVVRNERNKVLYFISQIVDISKQKEQEQELKRIVSLTQDQNERLKNFAHIVSHNLRSHSGGISTLIDFLKDENPEFFNNKMMQLLEASSENLKETIEHLSEVVQINLSSKNNFSLLPLRPIVEKQMASILPLAEKHKVKITNNIDSNLKVLAIKAYLESIVLNFITNAIKYSSNKRNSFLEINSTKNGSFTIIEFKDNGIGIDLNLHSKKLFGMYKTFHKNKDARGIGLFITKNQIETLGGKVEVSSQIDQGTTFKVFLKHEKN